MANLLYRLGRFSGRRPWVVIVGWIVALGLAVGGLLAFGGTLATSFSIPGTETQRVNDQLKAAMPDLTGLSATVVFQSEDGAFTDVQKTEIGQLLTRVGELDGIVGTTNPFTAQAQRDQQAQQLADGQAQIDAARAQLQAAAGQLPAAQLQDATAQLDARAQQLADGRTLLDAASAIRTVSADGTTALGVVSFQDDLFTLPPAVKDGVKTVLDDARIDGVTVAYSSDIATSTDGLIGPGEIVGLLVAVIVLIVMLRALLPALIPLLSSLIGVGVGVAGSLAFSSVADMSSVTPVLGVMLGLAVGIDYSLFILNRHRKQLLAGVPKQESIGLATGTSGNAVVFAGSTVLIALLALNVTGVPFLGVMGTVGAACVLVAVLVAISFTPALLGLFGMRVLGKRARARIGHPDHVAREVRPMGTARAVGAVALAVVGLLVIAIPALTMRLGLPDGSTEAPDTAGHRAYTLTSEAFGAGVNGPLLVIATLPAPVAADDLTAAEAPLVRTLLAQDGVVAVAPVAASDARDVLAFQVVPQDGPSSVSTQRLVQDLRGLSPLDGDIALGVAGQASGNIDVSQKLADVLPLYLAVVIGLSLLIMIVVFRSLLVPVIATAGFVLSLFATFGAMTAIFQWGWLGGVFGVTNPGPILSFAPIIIMGVLFGLAMDYQLFLVSGMREAYVHGTPARTAVVAGLRHGRAVVTAAAIIMISVFGGFVFSHLAMIRPLGFGLAIGVLFDAFVVRMLLVPGLMHLFGRAAWWLPRWLDRIIPNVDVEGAALERTHHVG
ncbi:MMPL family transporter [Microbacterium sp. X-17]|uniref:MMPL family transporter n=1 Tax=Microbacterium sp. X-17 TaxID=3144404 RepID=UPI0031F47C9B